MGGMCTVHTVNTGSTLLCPRHPRLAVSIHTTTHTSKQLLSLELLLLVVKDDHGEGTIGVLPVEDERLVSTTPLHLLKIANARVHSEKERGIRS